MKKRLLLAVCAMLCAAVACGQIQEIPYGNNPRAGQYAPVNGINIYYERYGKGAPLLMLHGNGGSMEAFRNQIPFFAAYYQVIAMDSRLQGKSGGSPDTISYGLMAADACALLDHLQIDSACVLGWSDGGINGLLMATSCPGKVKRLAISGANTVPDSAALPAADIQAMREYVAQTGHFSPQSIALNQMMLDEPNIPFQALGRISCPVLVMAGDRDIIKPEHTVKIFQAIPSASLCIFPGAHHGVCQQHPALFNEVVLAFFQR